MKSNLIAPVNLITDLFFRRVVTNFLRNENNE